MLEKRLIRQTSLTFRKQLDEVEYGRRNHEVSERLLQLILDRNIKSVHLFFPISKNKEPDVTSILQTLWEKKIQTVTSITDFDQRTMRHFVIDASTKLIENRLGIPEPQDAAEVAIDHIASILVPLVLADKHGNRIGYGGGFYDQLLKETKARKIGLSLSNPVDKIMQTDDWDVPLNYLITPFKNYSYG